jgi:hypothetical protein
LKKTTMLCHHWAELQAILFRFQRNSSVVRVYLPQPERPFDNNWLDGTWAQYCLQGLPRLKKCCSNANQKLCNMQKKVYSFALTI